MRWVVELPAPSGGTAATVTVESDSWAGALSSARGGVSIRKFRCEFENEGVVRVNDLEANERYTVRPYRASVVPPMDASRSALQADAAGLGSAAVPTASGRTSRVPAQSGGNGAFSVAPPPGNSVALPPRTSAPPTAPVAAEPAAPIDAPAETVVSPSVPATEPKALTDQTPTPSVAAAPVPAEPPAAPVVVVEPPAAPVVVVEPAAVVVAEAAAAVPETLVPAPAKPVVHADFAPTVVDLPIFVAPPPAVAVPAAVQVPAPEAPPSAPEMPEPKVHERVVTIGNGADGALVSSALLFERDQDPSATNPLTYRERVYSVAAGTSVAQAEALARQTLTTLKRSLATRPRGRYVTVAVFDHTFSHRPSDSPLVVLRWKDWRGDVADLQVRPALPAVASSVAPTSTPDASTEASAAPAASVDAPPVVADVPANPPVPVAPEPVPAVEESVAVEAPVTPAAPAPVAAHPAPVEPVAVVAPVEPVAVVTPVEPVAVVAPVEPAAVVAPVEPAAVETLVEPAAVETPSATPAVVEPALTAPPVEATAVTAPVERVGDSALAPPAEASAAPAAIVAAPIPEASKPEPERASEPVTEAASTSVEQGAEEHEPHASDSAGAIVGEAGSRRKKRRGRRESQPSFPSIDPAAQVATPTVVAADRKRFEGGRRGPDLLSDLFDSVMELSFQHSGVEVCTFVANVLTQNLRCDAVLVFSYDINRDEFVVHGEANTGRIEQRVRAKVGAYGTATRSKRGVSLPAARGDDCADAACEGGAAIFVPALFHDRLFALVQVARLPGSPIFEADELDAVTYIAGQLAEALAHHSMRQTHADEKKDPVGKDAGRRR